MQTVVAYLLILIGIAMEVISVLAWLKVITPVGEIRALRFATFWDILLELTRRTPWPAVVGLLIICAGLKLLGVPLPFQTEETVFKLTGLGFIPRPVVYFSPCSNRSNLCWISCWRSLTSSRIWMDSAPAR